MSGYQKALDILTSQGKFHINLGLERIQKILEIINNPQKKMKFVHVAGTNGKGSVCAMLSAILNKAGLKTAMFTSPHVFEYTERIKINDSEIEKEIFALKVIKITEIAQKNEIHLTEFEILTAVALEYFAENSVDIVVLETGLGGRLDATNIIEENLCSIITHIDFDHTERLGDTIEKIAFEKAGIIKANCPVVINSNNAGLKVIQEVANEKESQVFVVKAEPSTQLANANGLKGTYQKENLALVLKAIELLNQIFNISPEMVENGLKNVTHPCRFEYIKEENILVDAAHNPDGTKALRESLDYYFPNKIFRFIFGCLKNKNYPEMMKNLFKENDEIYFYHFDNPNSCEYEDLARVCELDSRPFSEFKADNSRLTVVCGSLYMIKELLEKMGIK